jgi:predicted dehydrogenase
MGQTRTWNIGVLGLHHDHVWTHVAELMARDDASVAVADADEQLRERARAEFGVERLHDDYAALLEAEQPDAVLIFTDNAAKAGVVELAASHGTPIMIEKPMADRLANAERMRVAVNRAGLPLMVNWPTVWNAAIRHAFDLAAHGAIGDVTRFNFRGGHGGPKEYGCSPQFYGWLYDRARNGAGAYIDYCGYGASLATALLGTPSRALATVGRLQKDYVDVDDNAVLVLRYPHAMAVIEATWTSAGPVQASGPLISGSTGTLVARRRPFTQEGEVGELGLVYHVTRERPDGQFFEPPLLAEGERSAVEHFLHCLATDQPFMQLVSHQLGRDTQEVLEAGLRAARDGREVSLPLDIL